MAYYDFSTFTEVDSSSKLTVNTNDLTATDLTYNTTAYLYTDLGAGNIGTSFEYRFKTNCTDHTITSGPAAYCFGIDNSVGYGHKSIGVEWDITNFGGGRAQIYLRAGGTVTYCTYLTKNTDYYMKVVRSGATVTLTVYSDSNYSNALASCSTSNHSATDTYQYLYAVSAINIGSGTDTVSFNVANLLIPVSSVTVTPTTLNVTTATVAPVRQVKPKKYDLFDLTTFNASTMDHYTVTATSVSGTNVQPGDRHWLYSTAFPNVNSHHVGHVTWSVSGTGAVLVSFHKYTHNTVGQPYIGLYISRPSGSGAAGFYWTHPDDAHYSTKASLPAEFWYEVICDINYLWTIRLYTDATRTTLWYTETYQGATTNFPYFAVYDDNQSSQDVRITYTQNTIGHYDEINYPVTATKVSTTKKVSKLPTVVNVTALPVTPTPKVTVNTTVIGLNGNDLIYAGTFTGTSKTETGVSFTNAAATPRGFYYASQYTSIYNPEDAVKFRGHLDFTASGSGDYAFVFWALKNNPTNAYLQFYCGISGGQPALIVNAANPNSASHAVVSNPPQEVWYEINVEANGYTFNVYSDATRSTLIGTYYLDYPHTNPTWLVADNQNYGTRTFTGTHDAIEIIQYAFLNVKALQSTSVSNVTYQATTLDVSVSQEHPWCAGNCGEDECGFQVITAVLDPVIHTNPVYGFSVTVTVEPPIPLVTQQIPTLDITAQTGTPITNVVFLADTLNVTNSVENVSIITNYYIVHVIATLETPTVIVTPASTTLDVTTATIDPTPHVTVAAIVDVIAAVEAPTILIGHTVQVSPIDVTITVESPTFLIGCTVTPDAIDIDAAVLAPIPQVIFLATTLDVTVNVTAPDIFHDCTFVATTINVTAALIYPALHGYQVYADVQEPLIVVKVLPDSIDVTTAVIQPTFPETIIYVATTLDVTVAVVAPTPIPAPTGQAGALAEVIAPTSVVIATPNTINVTVIAHPPSGDQTFNATTLDVTAGLPTTIIQVGVSGHVSVQANILSPTPQVALQPLTLNVTAALNDPNVKLAYTPGSLTVTGNVLPPLPIVTIGPNPLNVVATVHYDSAFLAPTLDVTAGLPALLPHITWYPNTLTVNTTVIPPTVDIFEGKSEWYFKMITYGGF